MSGETPQAGITPCFASHHECKSRAGIRAKTSTQPATPREKAQSKPSHVVGGLLAFFGVEQPPAHRRRHQQPLHDPNAQIFISSDKSSDVLLDPEPQQPPPIVEILDSFDSDLPDIDPPPPRVEPLRRAVVLLRRLPEVFYPRPVEPVQNINPDTSQFFCMLLHQAGVKHPNSERLII